MPQNDFLLGVCESRHKPPVLILRPSDRTLYGVFSRANKMSKFGSFIVLAILFFPGPSPADEAGPIAALCARRDLQALREAQEEMTVRDIAAATGIKESKLRQLMAKEGEIKRRGWGSRCAAEARAARLIQDDQVLYL